MARILKDVNVDFQVTGWLSENPDKTRFGPIGRAILKKADPHSRSSLKDVVDALYVPGENRVACLMNYYQPKYERVTGSREIGETILIEDIIYNNKCDVDDSHVDTFLGITKDAGKSWLYLVRGIEYMCREGHVLAVATNTPMNPEESWYTHGPNLKDIVEKEHSKGTILIPSHPLSQFGFGAKAILKAIKEPSGTNLGIQAQDLEKYAEFWDALEYYSLSMDVEQSNRVRNISYDLKLPFVCNSDGTLDTAFVFKNIFKEIDFSSPENLRAGIRKGFEEKSFQQCTGQFKTPLVDKIWHILGNVAQDRRYF